MSEELVDVITRDIRDTRAQLTRLADRLDALTAYRNLSIELGDELGRAVTIADIRAEAQTEIARAELRALERRITGDAGGDA